jgi:transposase
VEQLIERCAGIDIGKAELRVCARVPNARGELGELVMSYGTTAPDLAELVDWLTGLGVTHVAMESTGVYWKAPYYALEGSFEVLLVNAAHVKHVPGRKTDTIDAVWLAQLLAHGLLRASFVPPPLFRELRDLTRDRKSVINDHTRTVNRIHKVLEDAGVKLATQASDIMGMSGRAMMAALIAGQRDPTVLADMAKRRMRAKIPQLTKALTAPGFRDHHAYSLARMLDMADRQAADIESLSTRIAALVTPYEHQIELLITIPGVDRRSAEVILAEIGADMTQFPTAAHLASWAGLCPGQRESAGKRGSAKIRKGSKWLRAALIQSARAAARAKKTSLSERYRQVVRRRGDKKAIVAVAHDILVAVWWMLSTDKPYDERGADDLRVQSDDHTRRRAISALERLGHTVTLDRATA